jgi:hypothetical protein
MEIKLEKIKEAQWNGNGFGNSSAVYRVNGTEIEIWSDNPALHSWRAVDRAVAFNNKEEFDGEVFTWKSNYTIATAPTRKMLLGIVSDYINGEN